jgi:C-terminal processing protease CtpA/Prc
LIVDIRRTAEGPFETGIEPRALFVKTGTLAMVAGRDPQAKRRTGRGAAPKPETPTKRPAAAITKTIRANAGDGAIALPVTLLVTTGTSGAAELFAVRARRQQARRADRRAHARPRRHPEAGAPARRPRPLAHVRPLSDARRRTIQGTGLTPDSAWTSPTWTSTSRAGNRPILDAADRAISRRTAPERFP